MSTKAGEFLEEPIVTFDRVDDRDDGAIVSAFVQLREGVPAVRMVQPNPSVLVYFLLAADGLPTAISVLEPVSGVALCEIVETLVDGPGGPEGVEASVQHQFITAKEIGAVMRGMGKSLEGMLAS